MLTRFALIATAGAVGSLCRFGMSYWAQKWLGGLFPWGTLSVNVLGSFLFGLVFSLGESRAWLSPDLRIIVLVGFMGAFTTFSSYVYDTHSLYVEHSLSWAVLNVAAQNLSGIAALCLGIWLAK